MENRVRYLKNISGGPLDINGTIVTNGGYYEPSISWWLSNNFFDWIYSLDVSIVLLDNTEITYIVDEYIFSNYLSETHNYFTNNEDVILDIPIFSTRVTGGTFNDSTKTLTLRQNNYVSDVVITGFTDGNNIVTGYTSGNTLYLTNNNGDIINIPLPSDNCPSGLTIYDEGVAVKSNICEINFIGSQVQALSSNGNRVDVYIPTPTFASHWNTSDGTTNGTVTENISRSTARMSTPLTAEGNPFYIGTWAGTNQQATLNNLFIFTSTGDVTGFGGNSVMKVDVYVGSDVLIGITVSIANYSGDSFNIKYKCKPTVTVNMATIIPNGSKVKVVVTHTTDTTTDGGVNYVYTQNYVFYDNNPTTPQITGTTTISETSGSVLTKHISGIEYYILNSNVLGINDIN
jgi:hypothetical protein